MKVYVHIPFCHSKCAYCDFYSVARSDYLGRYACALLNEWETRRPEEAVDTLYFGGGTPSLLPPETLIGIAGRIAPAPLRELTVEANPEDVSKEWIETLVGRYPDIRISIGIQSTIDSELKAVGRRHTARQALDALSTLRAAGVGNISADLIYGLPGQSPDSLTESLTTLLDFRPEHLSCYLLSYEPRTLLSRQLAEGKITEASDALVEEMYQKVCEMTSEAGYRHYEISNFALPGREAIHNSSYWDNSSYIGLGPGAHSYVNGVRGANLPDLRRYLESAGIGVYQEEEESVDSRFNDLLITSLRTARGLSLREVEVRFGAAYVDRLLSDAAAGLETSDLLLSDGVLTIPQERWLTSNSIILPLIIA